MEKYLERGIFPIKYRDDALHIAIASVHDMDIVISWNMEHMVKLKTRREVRAVNILEGHNEIEICTPLEVIEND
jgi:hypothetical protein